MIAQMSGGSECCSGSPVPNLSIEVDDLDMILKRVKATVSCYASM